jgi:hypothetical protein
LRQSKDLGKEIERMRKGKSFVSNHQENEFRDRTESFGMDIDNISRQGSIGSGGGGLISSSRAERHKAAIMTRLVP